MLINTRVRHNPKYIKPKYGSGVFSSFTRLVSNAAGRVARSSKRGLNKAISIGKSGSQLASKGLQKALVSGVKAAKESVKSGNLNRALQAAVDSGSEIALEQLNRGVEAMGNYVKQKLEKSLPTGVAQEISHNLIDGAVEDAKEVGRKNVEKLSNHLTKTLKEAKKTTSTKSGVKRKKKSSASTGNTKVKRKKKVDWGDQSLNSIIARQ